MQIELYGTAPYARVYNPEDGPMMGRMLDMVLWIDDSNGNTKAQGIRDSKY